MGASGQTDQIANYARGMIKRFLQAALLEQSLAQAEPRLSVAIIFLQNFPVELFSAFEIA